MPTPQCLLPPPGKDVHPSPIDEYPVAKWCQCNDLLIPLPQLGAQKALQGPGSTCNYILAPGTVTVNIYKARSQIAASPLYKLVIVTWPIGKNLPDLLNIAPSNHQVVVRKDGLPTYYPKTFK